MHSCYQITFFSQPILIFGYVEQTSDRDERVICYIVNSAEYCHKTVSFFYILRPVDNEKITVLLNTNLVLYLTGW